LKITSEKSPETNLHVCSQKGSANCKTKNRIYMSIVRAAFEAETNFSDQVSMEDKLKCALSL